MSNKDKALRKSSVALNRLLKNVVDKLIFRCFCFNTGNQENKARKTFHEEKRVGSMEIIKARKTRGEGGGLSSMLLSEKGKLQNKPEVRAERYSLPFWMSHSILRMSTDVFATDILQALS